MTITEAKDNFDNQVRYCVLLIEYLALIPETFSRIFVAVDFSKLEFRQEISEWMEYISKLHGRAVYANPPDPIHFNEEEIPHEELSERLYEALGRNHPLFDAVHAPFVRPLDTQIALISVNYVWDAYDAFIKVVLTNYESKLSGLVRDGKLRENLSTDEKLEAIGLLDQDVNMERELLIKMGKELRSSFAHRFGTLTNGLESVATEFKGKGLKIDLANRKYEIKLFLSRRIVEAIQLKAAMIFTNSNKA